LNLLPSAEQVQIVDSLRGFLAEQAPVSRFRPPAAQVGNADAALWSQIGELGFLGVSVAESQGGIGLDAKEDLLVHREFGRHLLSPSILAISLAARLAAACDAADALPGILAGTAHVALANPRSPMTLGATCSGEFHLFDSSDAPLILCCSDQGLALFDRSQFTDIESVLGTDNVVALERAMLESAKPLFWRSASEGSLYTHALLLAAAYAVGIAEATRDMAVDYAKVREQFGKPIGSFQAVKHLCADMAIRAEAALCQASFAASAIAEVKPGANFQATAAKIVATKAALENAAQNIQVHGAIGFTSEADAHLYLKRAHVIDQLFGDQRAQRIRLIDLPFPEAA
jgi:alkylation response protein AidB-like acyl-CoA dehydrogenase